MNNKIFEYNGNKITFQLGNGDVMINATEMAKHFNKRPVDYLQNQQTKDFLNALSKVRKSTLADLVIVTKGGSNSGTWMHEDVALDFAQWLSVDFKLWCNDRIKELLNHGFTATESKLEEILTNPDLLIGLATELKKEREEKSKLQTQLKKQEAKIEFIDRVLDTDEKIDVGQAAKILELPFGRNTLFKRLREQGVFFKNKNEPKQQYIDRGYFQLKEKWIDRNEHDSFLVIKVLVTQRGLGFLSTLFKAEPKSKLLANLN